MLTQPHSFMSSTVQLSHHLVLISFTKDTVTMKCLIQQDLSFQYSCCHLYICFKFCLPFFFFFNKAQENQTALYKAGQNCHPSLFQRKVEWHNRSKRRTWMASKSKILSSMSDICLHSLMSLVSLSSFRLMGT